MTYESQSHVHETGGHSESHIQASVDQSQSGSQVNAASRVSPKHGWTRKKILEDKMASPQKIVG